MTEYHSLDYTKDGNETLPCGKAEMVVTLDKLERNVVDRQLRGRHGMAGVQTVISIKHPSIIKCGKFLYT